METSHYTELEIQTFRHLTEQECYDIQKKAERGDCRALLIQGMCFLYGQVSPIDFTKAYQSFERIAAKDALASCYCGFIAENGLGMSSDYISAIEYYAHAEGCSDKLFRIGASYTKVLENLTKMVSAAQKARNKFFRSVADLGLCIHECKDFTSVLVDYNKTDESVITSDRMDILARIALLQDNEHCMNLLGQIHEYDAEMFDLDRAIRWYELAVAHGSKESEKNLNNFKKSPIYHTLQSRELPSFDDVQFGQNSIELQIIAAENGDTQSIMGLMRPGSYSNAELDSLIRDCSSDIPFYTSLSYGDSKDCQDMWNTLINQEIQRINAADAEKKRLVEEERQRQIMLQKAAEERRKQEVQLRLKAEREAEEECQRQIMLQRAADEKRRQEKLQQQKEKEEQIRRDKELAQRKKEYESLRGPITNSQHKTSNVGIGAVMCYIFIAAGCGTDSSDILPSGVLFVCALLSIILPLFLWALFIKHTNNDKMLKELEAQYPEFINNKQETGEKVQTNEGNTETSAYMDASIASVLFSGALLISCSYLYDGLKKMQYSTTLIHHTAVFLGGILVIGLLGGIYTSIRANKVHGVKHS